MTAPRRGANDGDHGAILVTMLLIVTVMAAVAVTLLDDVRFGVRRSVAAQASNQARWYAMGAEALALEGIRASIVLDPDVTSFAQPWAQYGGPFLMPGGQIDARLRDASNCFNVNSLVQQEEGGRTRANPGNGVRLTALLTAFGLDERTAGEMTAVITDWIDSDTRADTRGAEDFDYQLQAPPYRTGNTLIVDITTLRALEGTTPELYALLSQITCARPTTDASVFNVNTLDGESGAILLAAVLGDDVSASEAAAILDNRPTEGYRDLVEFWALPELAGKTIPAEQRALLGVKASYFELNARVLYSENDTVIQSLFEVGQDNRVRHVTRQFGEEL